MTRKFSTLILIASFFIFASDEKPDTLKWYEKSLADMNIFYFGFSNEMGDFHNSECNFWGFDIGMLLSLNNGKNSQTSIILGLGGSWLDNSIMSDLYIDNNNYLSYPLHIKFGGVRLGMLFFNKNMFQPSFDILVAGGNVNYNIPEKTYSKYKQLVGENTDDLFVIMPKINLEIKLVKYLKFGWGFSYRIVRKINAPWSSNKQASDFGYHGLFKIGNF